MNLWAVTGRNCGIENLGADDGEQFESVAGVGAGGGEEHDEELVTAGAGDDLALQVEETDLGVEDSLVVGAAHGDVVVGPQGRELGADVEEGVDELGDVGITLSAGGGGPEVGDVRAGVVRPVLG